MELRNCPECGKLFTYVSRNLCPECIAKEDEMLRTIQSFLDEHKNATISEISEGTGVPGEKIVSLLQDGRLVATGQTHLLSCERCGASITHGRFCATCSTTLKKSFKRTTEETTSTTSQRREPESEKDKKDSGARVYIRDFHRKTHR